MPDLEERFLTNKQRKQLQHEIKNYVTKYFKNLLIKAAEYHKVVLWNDTITIRAKNLLTESEKQIIQLPGGSEKVKETRIQVAKQFAVDNLTYFEEKFGTKCIHQIFDVDAEKDFWIHVMIFDRVLIEVD